MSLPFPFILVYIVSSHQIPLAEFLKATFLSRNHNDDTWEEDVCQAGACFKHVYYEVAEYVGEECV